MRERARETMIDMSSLSNNHQFPEFTVAEYSTNFHSRFKGSTQVPPRPPNDPPGIDDLISDQARSTKVLDEKVHEEILGSCGTPRREREGLAG